MRPERARRLTTNIVVILALLVAGRLTRGMDQTARLYAAGGTIVVVLIASALWPRRS